MRLVLGRNVKELYDVLDGLRGLKREHDDLDPGLNIVAVFELDGDIHIGLVDIRPLGDAGRDHARQVFVRSIRRQKDGKVGKPECQTEFVECPRRSWRQ